MPKLLTSSGSRRLDRYREDFVGGRGGPLDRRNRIKTKTDGRGKAQSAGRGAAAENRERRAERGATTTLDRRHIAASHLTEAPPFFSTNGNGTADPLQEPSITRPTNTR